MVYNIDNMVYNTTMCIRSLLEAMMFLTLLTSSLGAVYIFLFLFKPLWQRLILAVV